MTMQRKAGKGYRVQCDGRHIEEVNGRPKNVPPATEWLGDIGPAREAARAVGFTRVGMKLDYCKECARP